MRKTLEEKIQADACLKSMSVKDLAAADKECRPELHLTDDCCLSRHQSQEHRVIEEKMAGMQISAPNASAEALAPRLFTKRSMRMLHRCLCHSFRSALWQDNRGWH